MSITGRSDDPVGRWLRDLVRAAHWHRRLLAGGVAAAATAFGLQALAPPPAPTVPAVTASHDLPSGARLTPADVEVAPQAAEDPAVAAKLTEVCPVDIYDQAEDGRLRVVEENLDLDRRVASRVQDLACSNCLDFGHGYSL